MSQLSRADEDRLKSLREKRDLGTITEEEDLVRSLLEDRYNVFLEEGVRKLRGETELNGSSGVGSFFNRLLNRGNPDSPKARPLRPSQSFSSASVENKSLAISERQSSTATEPSSEATCGDPQTPCFPGQNHWSWISSDLIVGAVPHAGSTADKIGHLLGLRDQLHHERAYLAVVLSCLDPEELASSPLTCDFAQPRDWEQHLMVTTFLHLPLPMDPSEPITIPHTEMLQVCSQIYSTMYANGEPILVHSRSPVAFIHCKAGRGRSWVVAMCYLTSQLILSFEDAAKLLGKFRPDMKPSPTQTQYVRDFVDFAAAPIARKKAQEEEQYTMVLASILSLAPKYRVRLLQDLQKLT